MAVGRVTVQATGRVRVIIQAQESGALVAEATLVKLRPG